MPLFEHEYPGKMELPDGRVLSVSPAKALQDMGPVLQVVISVTREHAAKLTAVGLQPPEPETGWALIDTGAAITAVDENVCRKLRLEPTGVVTMSHAGGSDPRPCYAIQIAFPSTQIPSAAGPMIVSFSPGAGQPYILLFGRDLLANLKMVYNGPRGRIELAF